jgi:hypothetical protein
MSYPASDLIYYRKTYSKAPKWLTLNITVKNSPRPIKMLPGSYRGKTHGAKLYHGTNTPAVKRLTLTDFTHFDCCFLQIDHGDGVLDLLTLTLTL